MFIDRRTNGTILFAGLQGCDPPGGSVKRIVVLEERMTVVRFDAESFVERFPTVVNTGCCEVSAGSSPSDAASRTERPESSSSAVRHWQFHPVDILITNFLMIDSVFLLPPTSHQ